MGMEEHLDQFGNYWDSVMKHWVKFTGLYPATPPTIIYQLVNWCRISSIHGSSSSKDKEWLINKMGTDADWYLVSISSS